MFEYKGPRHSLGPGLKCGNSSAARQMPACGATPRINPSTTTAILPSPSTWMSSRNPCCGVAATHTLSTLTLNFDTQSLLILSLSCSLIINIGRSVVLPRAHGRTESLHRRKSNRRTLSTSALVNLRNMLVMRSLSRASAAVIAEMFTEELACSDIAFSVRTHLGR
jgi:hypothetical protein